MFTTVFPPVLTPIPLRQADEYYTYIICFVYYLYICVYIFKHIYIYISGEEHTAALCGSIRPRQDRGDARRGKSGPKCARWGECLERD